MYSFNGSLRTSTRQSCRLALLILVCLDYLSSPSLAACPVSCPYCPCFTSSPYTFSVYENSPIGTTISILSATLPSGLPLTYNSESLDFNIDSMSGALTVGSELDYEMTSTYQFRVSAMDGSYTGRGDVTITILNRNDFAPQCSSSIVYFSVTEGESNVLLQLPNCTDNDVPSNPTFTYTMENTNSLFNIDQEGQITLVQPLDYELQQFYDLTVVVNDTDIPPGPLSTAVRAIVTVNPVNEFTPAFSMPRFEFNVPENTGIKSTVAQITATDQDSGDDGLITYSISSGQTDTFTIDPATGHLITTRSLDFELVSSYSFTVSVTDNSRIESSRRTSSTTVVINILDRNDNSPVFSQPVYYQEVPENSSPGSLVLQLVCTDIDSGPNQELVYSIISGNNERKFQIDSFSGELTLIAALDYDNPSTTDFFTLIGQCQEVAHPFRTSAVVVLLEVTSFNEFDPLPTSVEYDVFVSESTVPGTPILTVEATDRDRGQAGVLRYFFNYGSVQLDSCPRDLVSIDESTGVVYLISHLDFENGLRDLYCIATIWDSELPPRPNEADVRITVTNVNDVGPKCYPAINTVYVAENRQVGDSVFSLPCNDSDTISLRYSMPDQTPIPFTIDTNGGLVLRSSLDYETRISYIIPIQVSDGTFVANSSVYVMVTSVNEHTPVFTQQTYDCLVPENSLFGTRLLCNIQATDRDNGNDGVVNYRFSVSTDLFAVDDVTGNIFLTGSIDCELQSEYHLVIEAFDLGSHSFASTANVTVFVSDVNDNKPETMPLIFASIPENVPIGTGVTTVVCTDADQGINAEIELQILSVLQYSDSGNLDITADTLFNINPHDGVLTVFGDIDFELAQHYKLSILCNDHGTPSLSTLSTLYVEVTSVNEYIPVLSDPPAILHVSEDTAIGSVIVVYPATDQDRGDDGILSYSLESMTSLPFAVNEQSGVLTLSLILNCEQTREYTFSVVVQDQGQPSQSTQASVTVNITNCHLGEVVPSQNVYTASVLENAAAGSFIRTVECSSTRVNIITGIEPVYRIFADNSGLFDIDSSTGDITIVQSPDYETQHSYLISIQCYDPNYPNIASNFSMYIVVVPENEHTPEFTTENIILNVFESAPLGSSVLQLEAFDNDDGQDGELRYSFTGQSSSNFLLDPITGEIYLTATLDREVSDMLTFTATVNDMPTDETTRRSSSATVTVNILDSNDNWPQCARTVHHLVVSPQTKPSSVLLVTPECTDMDIGENAELVYELGDKSIEHMFEVNSLSGALTLIEELDSSDPVHFYIPLIVHDRGTPSLSTTVLVIIDVQEPDLADIVDTDSNDYISLVEAEGIKNSVAIVLEDFSRTLWELEGATNAEDNFQKAVAHSVTNYCALFPEACSLESGCSDFFGARNKRATDDNFATFNEPAIVILSNYTLDVAVTPDVVSEDTVSLQVQFYVTLPLDASRSPYRQTNYVVPRATLSLIVEQDGGTIQAVVRDSVSPPLTRVEAVDGWMIATLVILAIVIPTVLIVCISITVYKIKERSKNKVVPLISKNGRPSNCNSKTASKITAASASKRESKCSNSSTLSTASNKATISIRTQIRDRSVFISEASGRRESNDSTPRFDTPSDVSTISISDSEGASMDNHPSRPAFSRSPREMLNTLRDSKGLKMPERTSSNVSSTGSRSSNVDHSGPSFPISPRRPALKLDVPMWRFS